MLCPPVYNCNMYFEKFLGISEINLKSVLCWDVWSHFTIVLVLGCVVTLHFSIVHIVGMCGHITFLNSTNAGFSGCSVDVWSLYISQ